MIDKELLNKVLDERKFPCENMTKEERNYYFNILNNCKDICDSDNKVDNISKCEILKMKFVKKENTITIDGIMRIGSENRTVNAIIFSDNNAIVVDMKVTRYLDDGPKEYTVLDEFSIVDDKLIRKSIYNYDMTAMYDEINNVEMKGRLK